MREAPPLHAALDGLSCTARRSSPRTREMLLDDVMAYPAAEIAAELVARFDRALMSAWEDGWQPADLMRLVTRDRGKAAADALRRAIAWQAADYQQWGSAVAPEWMDQLKQIGARPSRDRLQPWPIRRPLRKTITDSMEVLDLLGILPPLPLLMPPPSQWPGRAGRGRAAPGRLDPGMLAKIRALLAKAESTQFDAEAETFTAKAQELMTRYRIDRAGLEAGDRVADGQAVGRRLGVDPPYARAKFVLVSGIARANSCRSVWSKGFGFATVFGHPEDIDAVDELYTSLLVQATSALRREGPKEGGYGAGGTRRFRRSFLIGFAVRISERLQEATTRTVSEMEAETGRDLVPVLDARERAAKEAMNTLHSRIRAMSISVSDGEGYEAGTRVADRADLGGRREKVEGSLRRIG